MQQYTKKLNGRSYIIQSVLGLGVYAALSAVVSARVFSADQLSLLTKLVVCGFLWGLLVYFTFILRRYYLQLPDE
jgi:hypothetical protein